MVIWPPLLGREKEVVLARQTLEYAVLMNSKEQKLDEFERNMAHLQTIYDQYRSSPCFHGDSVVRRDCGIAFAVADWLVWP